MLVLYLAPLLSPAAVWDEARERVVADRLTENLETGEVVWLASANGTGFPAVYTPPDAYALPTAFPVTVILLHSMGGHPDWPVVIAPLRKLFHHAGWISLSLQLPVLSADTPLSEYGKTLKESSRRIKSGITFLKERELRNIIMIGYGFGAATGAQYLAGNGEQDICGFAGISAHARKFLNPPLDLLGALGQLHVPVLDIYGERDQRIITQTADDRRLVIRKNDNSGFNQIAIKGADQYYTHQEQALFDWITFWLNGLTDTDECSYPYDGETQAEPLVE